MNYKKISRKERKVRRKVKRKIFGFKLCAPLRFP